MNLVDDAVRDLNIIHSALEGNLTPATTIPANAAGTINCLSPELMATIFSNLTIVELGKAAMVSKKWNRLSRTACTWKNYVHIHNPRLHASLVQFDPISNCTDWVLTARVVKREVSLQANILKTSRGQLKTMRYLQENALVFVTCELISTTFMLGMVTYRTTHFALNLLFR